MLCQAMVSDKPGGLSVCSHPFPPGKFEAQLKSAFGDSCYYFKLYLNLVDQLICMVLMFLKLNEQTDATTPNNMQQGVQTDIW